MQLTLNKEKGRVNRYKGLIIRKNVAQKYLKSIQAKNNKINVWEALFLKAAEVEGKGKNKCELVPFWHVEPDGETKIERLFLFIHLVRTFRNTEH
jgi:hypothetical protein